MGFRRLSPALCGGLIEACRTWATCLRGRRLSPALCGGLIEVVKPRQGTKGVSLLSPALCGGLIEVRPCTRRVTMGPLLSPALCGGLIEVQNRACPLFDASSCYPPPCAGASLKCNHRPGPASHRGALSPALCGGLIEVERTQVASHPALLLSPALCGGLIEVPATAPTRAASWCYPPPCAGASLKPHTAYLARQQRRVIPRLVRGPH